MFNWLILLPEIERVMTVFGASRDHHGLGQSKRPDLFQKFAEEPGLLESVISWCKPATSSNNIEDILALRWLWKSADSFRDINQLH